MRSVLTTLLVCAVAQGAASAQEKPSIGKLTKELRSKQAAVRLAAVKELGRLGPAGSKAAPALFRALRDSDRGVAALAVWALGRIGPKAIPILRKGLRKRETQMSVLAVAAEMKGPAAPLMPDMLKLLRSADLQYLNAVKTAAVAIGPPAVPHLRKALGERVINGYVAEILRDMRKVARPAAPELIRLMLDKSDLVNSRGQAASALGACRAVEAVPALIQVVDELRSVRSGGAASNAIRALSNLGPPAKSAVPVLIEVLTGKIGDGNDHLRAGAASALGSIGATSPAAIRALRAAAKDKKGRYLIKSARRALDVLDPAPTAPLDVLLGGLGHRSEELRVRAAQRIGARGAEAKDAVDPLVEALAKDASSVVRTELIAALGKIGPDAKAAIPILEKIIHAGGELATAARAALARIRP